MGWSGGAKVLCKLSLPGRPTDLDRVGQEPIAIAIGLGRGCLDILSLVYNFSRLTTNLDNSRARAY